MRHVLTAVLSTPAGQVTKSAVFYVSHDLDEAVRDLEGAARDREQAATDFEEAAQIIEGELP